jgi:hypothetical protein
MFTVWAWSPASAVVGVKVREYRVGDPSWVVAVCTDTWLAPGALAVVTYPTSTVAGSLAPVVHTATWDWDGGDGFGISS